MIYRGFAHSVKNETQPRVAQNLTYRGIAHDGLSRLTSTLSHEIRLVYRGQSYSAHSKTMQATVEPSLAQRGNIYAGALPNVKP